MESEIERLEREILDLLSKAEEIDAEEDELYGKGEVAHPISASVERLVLLTRQ